MLEYFATSKHRTSSHDWSRITPLPNVWLGVSVENQAAADERIPLLLQIPAAVRFLSCEPLLGPVTFRWARWMQLPSRPDGSSGPLDSLRGIHWVIAGGESGAGARPMHPDWARSLRDECNAAGVPFFFKQWGAWYPAGRRILDNPNMAMMDEEALYRVGKKAAGRLLDGREWNEFPNNKERG
jgi:protein gp37